MLSSFKLTQSVAYLLVCSLVVSGLIPITTLPVAASMPAPSGAQATPKTGTVDEATKARVSEAYNQLPLRFEENRGQVDTQVKYLSRGSASTLFLTKTEAVLTLQASSMSVVRMKLHGANRSPGITGEHEMRARTNYFIGNDPQQWRGDVAQYERVRYSEVYPGIDLLYYGQQQSLEYDFEVAPGADPQRIMLGFKGVRHLKIEAGSGDLLLKTGSGEVRQHKPVVYQEEENGERREVEGRYVLKGKRKVGFKLGAYDQRKRLVIDPVLTYSTYLGGSTTDEATGLAIDSSGNAYVTGLTGSNNFPTVNQYQTEQGGSDVFVAKLNTNVSGAAALLYSTYLGGSGSDGGNGGGGISVDAAGTVYVMGTTFSSNFPILNQYQTFPGGQTVFVTKLNTNLSGTASLVYSTRLGGNGVDRGTGIAIDSTGNAYLTGETGSTNFPILNQYQTFQGGLRDIFVAKLNTNVSGAGALVYGTYLGGSQNDDHVLGIAVDSLGNAYVSGYTNSNNFPLRNQYQTYQGGADVYVAILTALPPPGDFDGDGKTDLGLWHPTSGEWEIMRSSNNSTFIQPWGMSGLGDKPVPGDYDGDGKTDLAVWRPAEAAWYILQSSNNTLRADQWGVSDDKPAPADFDGDHKTDLVVYRPSEGTWYVLQSSNNSVSVIRWGLSEDKPVPADYDGDQKADVAVFRPSTSVWYIQRSTNTGFPGQQWGRDGDQPVVGDYDGDSKADIAVWRPSAGAWLVLRSSTGGLYPVLWGASGDIPVPGDYDADGKTDTAVWHPPTGTWYVLKSSNGMVIQQQFGSSGDIPVPSAYQPE